MERIKIPAALHIIIHFEEDLEFNICHSSTSLILCLISQEIEVSKTFLICQIPKCISIQQTFILFLLSVWYLVRESGREAEGGGPRQVAVLRVQGGERTHSQPAGGSC